MLRVYLASQFSRQKELLQYRDELESVGIEVTSSWIFEESSDSNTDNFEKYAEQDLFDIEKCDILVSFTGEPYSGTLKQVARGGRHFEAGYAMGILKELVLCGPRENIFHYTGHFILWNNWHDTFKYLVERSTVHV